MEAEIETTPAMIEAGGQYLYGALLDVDGMSERRAAEMAEAIFRLMAALSPARLTPRTES